MTTTYTVTALRTMRLPRSEKRHEGYPEGDLQPCAVCGRTIRNEARAVWVHIVDGGGVILHRDDEAAYASDGGDLGLYPVGPECAKRIPKEYRQPAG